MIKKEWVKPGLHLSCVGADMPGKEEIEPEIFRGTRIFTDDTLSASDAASSNSPLRRASFPKKT